MLKKRVGTLILETQNYFLKILLLKFCKKKNPKKNIPEKNSFFKTQFFFVNYIDNVKSLIFSELKNSWILWKWKNADKKGNPGNLYLE